MSRIGRMPITVPSGVDGSRGLFGERERGFGDFFRLGRDERDGVADALHLAFGQHALIEDGDAEAIRSGDVLVRQHGVDTRQGARRGDERLVRRATPMGDDGELHTEIVRSDRPLVGLYPVTPWCRTRYPAAAAPRRAAAFGTGSSR